ncbi:GNAT family N-acetyltransferase [Rhodoblastus sphagnicola]|uniref:GNAT family N-acetyltransferase n=1 Tax=Rhodoblastus sphagnicola TaxID=333368 RepID=A0A2S6MX37_9HYPH|nr:GNAT family N-acetyltransferase [Rhodoblastus sphagnicola]MBB4199263.1 GNAT superfamily N-acetyltransferase [Rhodoblastus sphagnicola]PPQ26932.1 GNAT family N-acetyltransferase [Rhodoblastus sphagnicola]
MSEVIEKPSDARSKTIRVLTPADLDRITQIDRAIIGQSRRGFFENRLQASVRDAQGFISLGYIENGVLEGFVLAQILDGEFGGSAPVAVLDAVATSETVRGHGGARALLDELKAHARAQGATEIRTQAPWTDRRLAHFFAAAGFVLGHRLVLERDAETDRPDGDDAWDGDDSWRDEIPVRSLVRDDLATIIGIDRRVTGRDRTRYYERMVRESLRDSGVRMSMIAESDGVQVGFIMARVDYGEFGETATEAVMDTLGVHPDFAGKRTGSALMKQLLANLQVLRVERVRTEVKWDEFELLGFLRRQGFRPSQRLSLTLAL